uniref:NADH-ubiquinone oxidoreductase chain 6 n=1 Tax=Hydrochus carinatus TaxID=395081 RepID=A0A343A3V9_9COLE|nr:NADH dehydrogenase subunit 6 [Hydrochus carinatus]AOY39237.1 NADH dehydrogenase subunit 6 [Hydrochus carinatus]
MMMMSLLFTTMFIILNHPMSMGFILLIQTILISLITGLFNYNWWFSYILFIIMIGGMMVLFIYMTSIASNEKFKFSYKITIFNILILPGFLFMNDYLIELKNNNSFNMENMNNINIMLNKFLCLPSNMIMFMMIIYLLITLIAIVKIANIKKGPLRQMN